jgi:glyoxalase superfamily protein
MGCPRRRWGNWRDRFAYAGQAGISVWPLADPLLDREVPDVASKFTELAIDCADPSGLARFWCSVLDYEVQDEDDGVVTIGSPLVPEGRDRLGPVPPTLTFARVPEGKTVKNRLHLDVNPTDREQGEEVRRLLGLGARHADVGQGPDVSWVVMADPEGNEFCVLAGRCP